MATWPVEVVAIRFGGVGTHDLLAPGREGAVFLRRRNCLTGVQAVLATAPITGRYTCFYAMSDNTSPHSRHQQPVQLAARCGRSRN